MIIPRLISHFLIQTLRRFPKKGRRKAFYPKSVVRKDHILLPVGVGAY